MQTMLDPLELPKMRIYSSQNWEIYEVVLLVHFIFSRYELLKTPGVFVKYFSTNCWT